jgi:2-C-methyl-D-erythritol 2,4-cyclodiphosphate synthase
VPVRIGNGYDIHKLVVGRPLILGGVQIPFEFGLEGHSDADVLAHAITDALLGAAALGDIGIWFPPNEPRWENADSMKFIKTAVQALADRNYRVVNVDTVIICERPRLAKFFPQMRARLAEVMRISEDQVSIKATTNETLGHLGRGEGIAAQAVVLIEQE